MKTIYLFLLPALFFAGALSTQQDHVTFGYDAAGNRVSRTIVLAKNMNKAKSVIDEEKIEPVTEVLGEIQLRIYPNPTKGQLGVEVIGSIDNISGIVYIYTVQGVLIEEQRISSTRTNLDISAHPSGTYILKVSVETQNSTWKIIKE